MEQRSEEWFAARRGRVTASMAGAILGVAPYMTREDAMRRMVRDWHGAESEFMGNAATGWGVANEPGALFDFTLETGIPVKPCGFFEYQEWAGASPDGLIGDESLIEVKCPFSLRNDDSPRFKTIKDQPHYYAQVQFQLWVTGRKSAHFWQWTPKGRALEDVAVNQYFLNVAIPAWRAFYDEFLIQRDNPTHLEPLRKVIESQNASRLLSEYDDLSIQIEFQEARKKEIMDEFIAMAGGKDSLICGRKFTQVEKAGAISYAKAIKDLAPDADLEPYRGKKSSYWKLS